jgi:Divergent InlB B-repeat domain
VRRLLLAAAGVATLVAATATTAAASTWCGSATTADLLPQVAPGPSVHLVYAYPSDGADRIAEVGTTMQTDAETIDAWWRGQDPTRTPRFDTFAFSCGPQLDISDVRLPLTGADLTPSAGRFEKIINSIASNGFNSLFEVYLVYYDGPDDDSGICGEGGTSDPTRGQAYAVVFTGGCSPEPTAVTAAHEMTHALGAVSPPAPHECPSPNGGHACDSNRDLMYPFVDGSPLASLSLDVGRDDYYGATGIGFDVRTSRWLRHLDEPSSHLTVGLTGAGTVASDVPGITCTASCASDWDGGQQVTLSATPAGGMRFVRWGGACSGDQPCQLALGNAVTVSALFAPRTYPLTLAVQGHGALLNSATAAVCQRRCRLAVTSYQAVSLRAVAQPGWRFKRWAGSCHGTRATCSLPMKAAGAATALFVKKRAV